MCSIGSVCCLVGGHDGGMTGFFFNLIFVTLE